MRINSFSVRGLKALRDVTLFPGRINVLTGSTGAGKSTLLESIAILSAAMTDRASRHTLARKGVRQSAPGIFKSSFRADGRKPTTIGLSVAWQAEPAKTQYEYAVTLHTPAGNDGWRYQTEVLHADKAHLWGRSGASIADYNPYIGMFMLDQSEALQRVRPTMEPFQRYVVYRPSGLVLQGQVADPTPAAPLGLHGGRLAEALETLMVSPARDALLAHMRTSLRFLEGAGLRPDRRILTLQDRFMRPTEQFTSLDAGEGMLQVLFLLCLALHPQAPPVFAVDGLGSGMDPALSYSAAHLLGELMLSQGKTVFLSTHNPYILEGLKGFDAEVRFFLVSRDEQTGYARIAQNHFS